jgi:oligopeptide/dipeptide ABC transporter ATP-binding protein
MNKIKNTKKNDLLSMENISVSFYTHRGIIRAVRNLNLNIKKGETLALVGESGCGKSVTAHAINQLIPTPQGKIETGKIFFEGKNLLELSEKEIRNLRGSRISMIFQEPMTSLNPVFKIGDQISDVFITHYKISKKEAFEKTIKLLEMVKIASPRRNAHSYPHQLSGGMRQRAMIAMALASPEPGLLIADEPTTALDVTIQAQILKLISDLKKKIEMSILLITHDMGVVAEIADKVVVMYAGRKVEEADVYSIFDHPNHPYTLGLLNSLPSNKKYSKSKRLEAIKGTIPDLLTIGEWCPFENRCPYATNICKKEFPEKTKLSQSHFLWCHNYKEVNNKK